MICSYPFIVPPCYVQNFTDRIFGMHDRGHHGGHNLYVWILKDQMHTHTKTFPFVFLPFPFHFLSHSFHACLFSCQFPFTSFHVPSISFNHIFVLRSSYFISLLSFCFFMSFWCSSDFPFRSPHFPSRLPFMSLSFCSLVTSVSVPFPSSHSVFLVCPVIV